jgi:cell division protein FtsL
MMPRASALPFDAALLRTSRAPVVPSSSSGPIVLVSAIMSAALVTASLIFLVWVKMSQVQLGYEIHRQQSDLVKLRQEKNALEVEVSALRRPERLLRLAAERLDLHPPRPDQLIVVGQRGQQ